MNTNSTPMDEPVNQSQEELQESQQLEQNVATDSKVSSKVVSYGHYWDIFKSAKVHLSDGRTYNLEDSTVDVCSLADVSLAIMAEHDYLSKSSLARDKELLSGYESTKVKYSYDGTTKLYNISLANLAKGVLDLIERYKTQEFVELTIGRNWNWTSHTSRIDKNNKKFDPYNFSRYERDVQLKNADMVLLVKAFRLYLIETVRRCFPKVRNPEKWDSSGATYRVGGIDRSTSVFVAYMEELFKLFNQITKLSDTLDEHKQIVKKAGASGRRESRENYELSKHQKRLEDNYNKATNSTSETVTNPTVTSADVARGVLSTGLRTQTTSSPQSEEPTKNSQTIKEAKIISWKTAGKELVHKLVDSGLAPEDHFSKKDESNKDDEQINEQNDDVNHVNSSHHHKKSRDFKSGKGGRGFGHKGEKREKSGFVKRGHNQDQSQQSQKTTDVNDHSESQQVQQKPSTVEHQENQSGESDRKKKHPKAKKQLEQSGDDEKWVTVNTKNSKVDDKQKQFKQNKQAVSKK